MKALTAEGPKDPDLAAIAEQAHRTSLGGLQNHLNFWEKASAILGAKAKGYFKASLGSIPQAGGSKWYPIYPYLFGPLAEGESEGLVQKIRIAPEQ